jgi:hypothetical protein
MHLIAGVIKNSIENEEEFFLEYRQKQQEVIIMCKKCNCGKGGKKK